MATEILIQGDRSVTPTSAFRSGIHTDGKHRLFYKLRGRAVTFIFHISEDMGFIPGLKLENPY
jgi:hypothetical protein